MERVCKGSKEANPATHSRKDAESPEPAPPSCPHPPPPPPPAATAAAEPPPAPWHVPSEKADGGGGDGCGETPRLGPDNVPRVGPKAAAACLTAAAVGPKTSAQRLGVGLPVLAKRSAGSAAGRNASTGRNVPTLRQCPRLPGSPNGDANAAAWPQARAARLRLCPELPERSTVATAVEDTATGPKEPTLPGTRLPGCQAHLICEAASSSKMALSSSSDITEVARADQPASAPLRPAAPKAGIAAAGAASGSGLGAGSTPLAAPPPRSRTAASSNSSTRTDKPKT